MSTTHIGQKKEHIANNSRAITLSKYFKKLKKLFLGSPYKSMCEICQGPTPNDASIA